MLFRSVLPRVPRLFKQDILCLDSEFIRLEVRVLYAIVETGGKQYKVAEGSTLYIEKLDVEAGSEYTFDKVLFVEKDGKVQVGSPFVAGAKVVGTVVEHGKGKKIIVFKYKSKKNYRRKQGHRQPFTKVKVTAIEG